MLFFSVATRTVAYSASTASQGVPRMFSSSAAIRFCRSARAASSRSRERLRSSVASAMELID